MHLYDSGVADLQLGEITFDREPKHSQHMHLMGAGVHDTSLQQQDIYSTDVSCKYTSCGVVLHYTWAAELVPHPACTL